jgi:small subunit ribosomal protein S5e
MSDGGIEVENSALVDILPKDVVKEVGNVKLFNKWDYDVEVRDISLTYVDSSHPARWILESVFTGLTVFLAQQ